MADEAVWPRAAMGVSLWVKYLAYIMHYVITGGHGGRGGVATGSHGRIFVSEVFSIYYALWCQQCLQNAEHKHTHTHIYTHTHTCTWSVAQIGIIIQDRSKFLFSMNITSFNLTPQLRTRSMISHANYSEYSTIHIVAYFVASCLKLEATHNIGKVDMKWTSRTTTTT